MHWMRIAILAALVAAPSVPVTDAVAISRKSYRLKIRVSPGRTKTVRKYFRVPRNGAAVRFRVKGRGGRLRAKHSGSRVLLKGRLKRSFKGRLFVYWEKTASTTRVNSAALPYLTVGFVDNGNGRGTGVVCKHPKVFLSAAHVFSDRGSFSHDWLPSGSISFHPGHDASSWPSGSGQGIQSYWFFTNYATEARKERSPGSASARTYNYDFVAAYSYSNFANGAYAGYWGNGIPVMKSKTLNKMIVGYPAGTAGHYLEKTGPFRAPYQASYGRYHSVYGHSPVDTGGNSGGPVFVYNKGFQEYIVAGIHVSGGSNPKGAVGLESSTHSLIDDAIDSANSGSPFAPARFSRSDPVKIPDNDDSWTTAPLEVAGLDNQIASLLVNLEVEHSSPEDLEAWLRSPQGRWVSLSEFSSGSAKRVSLSGLDVSESLLDLDPNGIWKIYLRDLVAGNAGVLEEVGLEVTAH
jgi:hypothetical protein